MSDKRLRDCGILQLLDEGNKSDLSDFSEGEDEQLIFPLTNLIICYTNTNYLVLMMLLTQKKVSNQ